MAHLVESLELLQALWSPEGVEATPWLTRAQTCGQVNQCSRLLLLVFLGSVLNDGVRSQNRKITRA